MLIKRNPDIPSKKVDQKVVLLDENKALLRELNEVASFIWNVADEWITIEEIIEEVDENFETSNSQELRNDVQEFIEHYIDEKFFLKKEVKENG
jgi:hypothetical protein